MNAIQIRLHAEECFNKYCSRCFHSAKKGRNCYPMRRAKMKNIKEIEKSYAKFVTHDITWEEGYWECFKKED